MWFFRRQDSRKEGSPCTAEELGDRLRVGNASFVLLDVRTDRELAIASLPNAVHIPLAQLSDRYRELDPTREIVVMCHHGGRSAAAVRVLGRLGFANARNLAGGIDAYARKVDPGIRRY